MSEVYSDEWGVTIEPNSLWTCMKTDEANGFERGYITSATDVGNDMVEVEGQFRESQDHTMSKGWFLSHFMRVRSSIDADIALVADAVFKFNDTRIQK